MTNSLVRRCALAFAGAALVLSGAGAYAGTSYESYSTTVGKLNGNGYISYQKKSATGAEGTLKSSSVGGSHVVDARMQAQSGGGTGAWTRGVNDGETRTLKNTVGKAGNARVQFSTNWNTRVDVQVTGSWRSN